MSEKHTQIDFCYSFSSITKHVLVKIENESILKGFIKRARSQVCQNDWQNTCSTFSPLELVPYAFAWFGFGGHSKISTLRCWKFNSSITSPKTWDMLYFVGNTQIAVLGHLSIGPYSIELFAWLYCHFSYVTLYGENEKQNISP